MHGVKNNPGLIPTERELKLTTKTIEKGENKDHANILLSKAISKTKTKSPKSKHFDKPQSLNSVDSSRSGLVNSLSDEAYISSEAEENPVEKAEQQHSAIAKYNPHVCPFCDQSFKQLPHLGAHIMAAHEPPTESNPGMKNNKQSSLYSNKNEKIVGKRLRKKRMRFDK